MAAKNSFSSLRLVRPPHGVRLHRLQTSAVETEPLGTGTAAKCGLSRPANDGAGVVAGSACTTAAQSEAINQYVIAHEIRREVEAEYAEKWRLAAQVIDEARLLKARVVDEADIITLRLAFEIAKKVIHREATVNPDIVIYNIREALRLLRETSTLTLHLHPEDLQVVQRDEVVRQELEKRTQRLEFKANTDIQRGGCLLESDAGIVDARVESQIAEIERIVAEVTE